MHHAFPWKKGTARSRKSVENILLSEACSSVYSAQRSHDAIHQMMACAEELCVNVGGGGGGPEVWGTLKHDMKKVVMQLQLEIGRSSKRLLMVSWSGVRT